MNDSPSVRQIERGSYAPHYRKSSAWIFLSSDDSKSSASSFPSGGGPEASVDLCLSLLTSGEAARDDAGAGDEIPPGIPHQDRQSRSIPKDLLSDEPRSLRIVQSTNQPVRS